MWCTCMCASDFEGDLDEAVRFGVAFGVLAAVLVAVIIVVLLALFLRSKGKQTMLSAIILQYQLFTIGFPKHQIRKLE